MAINIPIVTAFVDKGIQEAEKAFGKFGKTGVLVGAAFAAVSTAVVAGLGLSVQAAVEDQRSQELLEKQLYNTLRASEKTTKATEDFVGQMELATGVADNQLRVALGNLVRSTGDLTTAQDLLGLSLDISTATGKDLESVSIALAKASMGQFTALGKLGIPLDENIKKTKDFSQIQATLDKQFGGASATAADTFGGQLARLGTVWDNLTESIGYAILNNMYVKDALGLLPDAADKAIKAFGEQGLTGAFGVFLDNMGIVGAYVKMWGASVVHEYNLMAARANNALQLLSLGLVQLVPGYRAAMKEVESNLIDTTLQMDASRMYIDDLTNALKDQAAQTRRNATESERWAQYVESLGLGASKATPLVDLLGTAATKAAAKAKAMAAAVKEAASALDKDLKDALEKAQTGLADAQETFDDFATKVSDGIKDGFSFGKVLSDAAEESKTLATAIKETKTAIAEGLNKTLDIATDRLKDAKTAFADFAKTVSNGIKESFSFKQANEGKDGFITGLRNQVKAIKEYNADIQSLLQRGLSQEALKQVLAAGSESGALIARNLLTGAQEDITGPEGVNALVASVMETADKLGLDTANKFYGEGVSSAQKYFDGIKSQFDQATEAVNAVEAGTDVTSGFLEGLNSQIVGIKTYGDDINTLLQRGISLDALQAVLDAGGESGAAIAHELVLGAQENITGPTGVNALVKSVNDVADRIALAAANQWYGAGVSNAQSYLQGVEAAFAEAQKRLAKKGLKIADIKGISASFSDALAGPSVTPINMSPEQGGGIPGGGSVVVNVNGGISTSAEIGKSVVDALTQYTQVYGPLNLAIR